MRRLLDLPLGVRILAGMLLGLTIGLSLPGTGQTAWADNLATVGQVAGRLWLAALQMTVLPLIFALLSTGLARAGSGAGGGTIAKHALMVFASLYALALLVGITLNSLLLSMWPVSASAIDAFRNVAAASVDTKAPSIGDIVLGIVPTNVFAALAAGAVLPVVIFALMFGLAMGRTEAPQRNSIVKLIETVADIMFIIVGWVLVLAPLGVLGLAMGTAHQTGVAMLWGLGGYLRHIVVVTVVMLLLAYPVAVLWGRVGLRRFAAGVAPSQLVALGTQSSVASLPVMLKSAKGLGVSDATADVTLPLAVSIFRFTGPALTLTVASYAAALAGVPPSLGLLAFCALIAMLMEFAAVGLPNQVSLFAISAPAFAALGAPLGFLPVFLSVDVIPDAIGTTGIVSMDIAATTAVDRLQSPLP
ncbi:MAG: cation:dicarboxylase symporter family transporter [Sphingomicrobium sp.]